MLRELNNELNSHIDEASNQDELKKIKDLLLLKISGLEILVATSNLLEEAEAKQNTGTSVSLEDGELDD